MIGNTITSGITIGLHGVYASPLTVTATGYIDNTGTGDAVSGPAITVWTIGNYGRIRAGTSGSGIDLQAGGTVINGSTGGVGGATAAVGRSAAGVDIAATNSVQAYFDVKNSSGQAGAALQTGSTISGTIAHGITLGTITANGNYASPLAVTQTGYIGAYKPPLATIYGGPTINGGPAYANISNFGTIANTTRPFAPGLGVGRRGIWLDENVASNIYNGATGLIAANIPIEIRLAASATISNAGTIIGPAGDYQYAAIQLPDYGSPTVISNGVNGATSALIAGSVTGIDSESRQTFVNNSGTIVGTIRGILLRHGGYIANSGLIACTSSSNYGIDAAGSAVVDNAGTISGLSGFAIEFRVGNDRLIADPGAVFAGKVTAAGTDNTLELSAAKAIAGSLSGIGTRFTGFDRMVVDPGANWTLTGSNTVSNGVTLSGAGSLTVAGSLVVTGSLMVASNISITGSLYDQGRVVVEQAGSISGTLRVGDGHQVEFQDAVGDGTTIAFGAGATLIVGDLASAPGGVQMQDFNAPIAGLIDGDKIRIATGHLGNFGGIDAATPGAFNGTSTPLVLKTGGNVVATLTLKGNYAGDGFGVSQAVGGLVRIGMQINAATDFNGDGTGDVLFRNDQNGQLVFAAMSGGALAGFGTATGGLGTLSAVGHGDVNGDGISDVIVQDPNSGRIYIAEQHGNGTPTWVLGPDVPGFTVVGVGDIQGDGYADIIVENATSGEIDYLDTKHAPNPNDLSSNPLWGAVTNTPDGGPIGKVPGWNVVGVGDVTGDGYADIVIQNPTSGEIDYINMAGGVASALVHVVDTPGYAVKAVADLTGDGFADIVVQNPTATADALYADMHGGVFNFWGVATTPLPPGYVVSDAADVFNNGHADLIVQQQSTGSTYYAQEGANGFQGWGSVSTSLNGHFQVV